MLHGEGYDGGQAVADAQTGQHAEQTQMGERVAEAMPFRRVDKAVDVGEQQGDGQTDAPEQEGALGYLAGAGLRPGELKLAQ